MGLFRKTKKPANRFPAERLASLPMMIRMSIQLYAKNHSLDPYAVLASKFFGGYLLGFPTYLDDIDENLGGAIRKMLFHVILGSEKGPDSFESAMANYILNDPQTKHGWGAGFPDGERYFRALEQKQNAVDSTLSLQSMFEIGLVDVDQLVL